jgi:hypothetical protein
LSNEQLTAQPGETLRELCAFLGVETTDDYLRDCASIVFKKNKQSRHTAPWNERLKQIVMNKMQQYEFLKHYATEGVMKAVTRYVSCTGLSAAGAWFGLVGIDGLL